MDIILQNLKQSLRVEQFLEKYKRSVMELEEKTNQDRALINFIDSIKSKFPVWNIAISSPDTDEKYTTPGTGIEINLSARTPNSRGFIQQIYSNYTRSVTCDLLEGESRSLPLLVIYLAKTSTRIRMGGFAMFNEIARPFNLECYCHQSTQGNCNRFYYE